ncbi:microtubule-associated proteins 1A/1B light chain 3C-like [Falco cherrug]|uniref:microtubule-associated proteins 1A/1B light chain 3C-like n=1 Tax=Falco cherrug TaxID=345164 RepID=UPI00247AC820|nr:microtubule-associated proteins 1A/1B light chain 3C-like [Falco cherrug]
MQPSPSTSQTFKQRKSLATRMHEVAQIRIKYPNKIPVVVERYQKEKTLPPLTRTKYLVAQDLPLSHFTVTLRTRLCLASSQTFFLLVNDKGLPNMAITMQELYRDHRDEDGFLYLTYASQEMFGASSSAASWEVSGGASSLTASSNALQEVSSSASSNTSPSALQEASGGASSLTASSHATSQEASGDASSNDSSS